MGIISGFFFSYFNYLSSRMIDVCDKRLGYRHTLTIIPHTVPSRVSCHAHKLSKAINGICHLPLTVRSL